ncbi:glycosyltransferase family 2 protein [Patescibacteria group bacterium]|nr:MAG: glycosyltransferase family 2 protein [Patescibacteria group bacterium]
MSGNKIISVCVPTYNRADCLKDLLNSIVCQFDNKEVCEQVEVVISDNASADNTMAVVKTYQENFDNIRYLRNQENLGFDRNLLNAIEQSSGQYCLTIGDDDGFFPGSFALLLEKIKTIGAPYFMLNCWGYDHWLKEPVLSQPNQKLEKDAVYDTLADFVKSIKNYLDLVGFFGGMSTQLFLRKTWLDFETKNEYIGTSTIHFFVLLQAFKNSRFALLAEPFIKTRNDNLRWDSYQGLENNYKRSVGTARAVFWIANLYGLPISRSKVYAYFLIRGCWVSFKELIKKILKKMGWRKK